MLIELRADDLHKQTIDQLLIMLVEATRASYERHYFD